MKNNTFQLDRFSNVIGRTFKQNKRVWLTSMLVFVGVPLLLFLFNLIKLNPTSIVARGIFFRITVVFVFILSPFIYFYGVNHPKKGLTGVMLPASVFEKYLNMMLFCMFIVPLSAVILYAAMDSVITFIFPQYFNGFAIRDFMTIFSNLGDLLVINLVMQSVFFLNLLFSSRKILKSIGAYILISVVVTILTATVTIVADRAGVFESLARTDITVYKTNRGYFDIYKSDHFLITFLQLYRIFMTIVVPIVLMFGSYFILKNKRY